MVIDFGNGVIAGGTSRDTVRIADYSGLAGPELDVATLENGVIDGGIIGGTRANMRRMTFLLDFAASDLTRKQIVRLWKPGVEYTLSANDVTWPYVVETVPQFSETNLRRGAKVSISLVSDQAYPVEALATTALEAGTWDSLVTAPGNFLYRASTTTDTAFMTEDGDVYLESDGYTAPAANVGKVSLFTGDTGWLELCSDGTYWYLMKTSEITRTSDFLSFTTVWTPASGESARFIDADSGTIILAARYISGTTTNRIYRSVNAGATWTQVYTETGAFNTGNVRKSGSLWFCSKLYSSDDGLTWTLGTDMPNLRRGIYFDGQHFAFGDANQARRSATGTSGWVDVVSADKSGDADTDGGELWMAVERVDGRAIAVFATGTGTPSFTAGGLLSGGARVLRYMGTDRWILGGFSTTNSILYEREVAGVSIDVETDVNTPAVVTVEIDGAQASFAFTINGRETSVTHTFLGTEVLIIDAINYTVTIDGVNSLAKLDSDSVFPTVDDGQNVIATASSGTLSIAYQPRRMGLL